MWTNELVGQQTAVCNGLWGNRPTIHFKSSYCFVIRKIWPERWYWHRPIKSLLTSLWRELSHSCRTTEHCKTNYHSFLTSIPFVFQKHSCEICTVRFTILFRVSFQVLQQSRDIELDLYGKDLNMSSYAKVSLLGLSSQPIDHVKRGKLTIFFEVGVNRVTD